MAELLSAGTDAAASSDFTLAAGASAALWLKAPGGYLYAGTSVLVERKDASGAYTAIGEMNERNPCGSVSNPGGSTETFRVRRQSAPDPVGVDRT